RKTGMVWHELSLSAGSLEWSRFPTFFLGIGSSFAYLTAAGAYVSTTGDDHFLQDHWSSFQSAYRYCLTVVDRKEGLPRMPRDKVGDDEDDKDRGDSLNLANLWVKATTAFASLAAAAGHAHEAATATERGEQAKRALVRRYWDEGQRRWISA